MTAKEPQVPDENWPPTLISYPASAFMMRRTEHRNANVFYHDVSKRAVEAAGSEAKELYSSYQHLKQYHLESFLCRLHDITKKYFEELLQEILISREGFFERNGPLEESNQIQKALNVAQKKSSRPIVEIIEFIASELKEPPFDNEDDREFVTAMAAVRNIIVHNDAMPDKRFLDRVGTVDFEYKLRFGTRVEIDEPWLLSGASQCDNLVFSFDQLAIGRMDLPTRNRFGLFWMR